MQVGGSSMPTPFPLSHTPAMLGAPPRQQLPLLSQRGGCSASRRRQPAAPCAASHPQEEGGAYSAAGSSGAVAHGPRQQQMVAVLGGEDFIYSQRSGVSEDLFKGDILGVDADVAGAGFRQTDLRSLAHLPEGLKPPARFLERVAVHFARNVLAGTGAVPGQVPLVQGIWGCKGAGKSFNLELSLREMGVLPVCLSAGELEDEWAGEPGRRLRERYRFAARHMASTGEATCLIISDMDAGVGTFANIANTVNTQIVQGSLMALCDDPLAVSTGQDWGAVGALVRVPIYITANDLTCLYAPLVREGRMDKFYFEPTREEMVAALCPLFAPHLTAAQVGSLQGAFPRQAMDFFGAVKSRLVDSAVREWLQQHQQLGASEAAAGALQLQDAAAAHMEQGFDLDAALAAGHELQREQQSVMDLQLAKEYMPGLREPDLERKRRRRRRKTRRPRHDPVFEARTAQAAREAREARVPASESQQAYWRMLESNSWVAVPEGYDAAAAAAAEAAEEEASAAAAAARAEEEEVVTAGGWPALSPSKVHAALLDGTAAVLDVRSARDWEWGAIKGALHAPFVLPTGTSLNPGTKPNPGFLSEVAARVGAPSSERPLVLYGAGSGSVDKGEVSKERFVSLARGGDDEELVAAAVVVLLEAGYGSVSELAGGYRAWDLLYRPDGRKRAQGAFRDKSSGELEWWTASN